MALNRFSASILKRSEGKNALARAAYNGRCGLRDERTGKEWDFRKKGGLEFEGIFAPENAPSWVRSRQDLWQAVENKEDQSKHSATAQLARDFKISLPHELNKRQREELISDFIRKELVSQGMIADVCIHRPEKNNDERNFHAHVLTTMRSITRDGFGNKNRDWNEKKFLESLREKWSDYGAKALHRAGYKLEAERFGYGHMTLDEQRKEAVRRGDKEHAENLDREATRPIGPNGKAMERDGIETARSQQNEETKERNDQRKFDREVDRDNKKRGKVAERLFNIYRKSVNAEDFGARLLADNLYVARVTKEDVNLYGPDYEDPRYELQKLQHLAKKGAWTTGKDGLTTLDDEQRSRARTSYEKYGEGKDQPMSFEGYVKYVQMQNHRRLVNLTEQAKALDFAGGELKKSDFHAKDGEYVVLTKNGYVYRLNQATIGETRDEAKRFMSRLDGKAVESVTETREMLAAMRSRVSQEWASKRFHSATKGQEKPAWKVADRVLDQTGSRGKRLIKFGIRTFSMPVGHGLNLMSKAMDTIADMFSNFTYQEKPHERKFRQKQEEEIERHTREYSRER